MSEDEIANAAGISDMHDGVNFMRAACVIAVEKVRLQGKTIQLCISIDACMTSRCHSENWKHA